MKNVKDMLFSKHPKRNIKNSTPDFFTGPRFTTQSHSYTASVLFLFS